MVMQRRKIPIAVNARCVAPVTSTVDDLSVGADAQILEMSSLTVVERQRGDCFLRKLAYYLCVLPVGGGSKG